MDNELFKEVGEVYTNNQPLYDLFKSKGLIYTLGETCRHRTTVVSISVNGTKYNQISFYLRDAEFNSDNVIKSISVKYFYNGEDSRFHEDTIGTLHLTDEIIKTLKGDISLDDFIDEYNLN